MNYNLRNNCLICNSERLETIIELGIHPFADTFIPSDRINDNEPVYPLECIKCRDCNHIQLKYITDPQKRYNDYEYSFTSSNSKVAKEHWKSFFNDTISKLNLSKDSLVVEIGSNDGGLGEHYIKNGNSYIGVDASKAMCEIARERKVKTIHGFFNKESVDKILDSRGKASLIIANNVLNHADSPTNFIKNINEIISENHGVFTFEVPYWLIEHKTNSFGKIYHEHVNYFTITSLKKLLDIYNFEIFSIQVLNYHGGSIRVYTKKKSNSNFIIGKEIQLMIEEENRSGVFKIDSYKKFQKTIEKNRKNLLGRIEIIKSKNYPIIGIGASAKGNTFLNFYRLDYNTIEYITDISVHKIGKLTPKSRIPITTDSILKDYGEVYVIVLTENLSSNFKSYLLSLNSKIKFIYET